MTSPGLSSQSVSGFSGPEETPADYYELGFQTEIHFKPRASPQAELRPGRLPTSRITTREAELRPGTLCIFCMLPTEDDDVMELPVKLPVRASSQRSPETRREPQRGTETHREASASAQTVSDQKVFRCLSKYYVTRRRLSSSLSSQVSICKVICFVLFCVFSVFFYVCMYVRVYVPLLPICRGDD